MGNSEWKKKLTTECIENVIMMMPFSATLIWTFGERQRMIWKGIKITFCLSVSIEFLQLFLRLGTFQLSDIFYNTLGGMFRKCNIWGMLENDRQATMIFTY